MSIGRCRVTVQGWWDGTTDPGPQPDMSLTSHRRVADLGMSRGSVLVGFVLFWLGFHRFLFWVSFGRFGLFWVRFRAGLARNLNGLHLLPQTGIHPWGDNRDATITGWARNLV